MTKDYGHTAGWRVQPRSANNQPIIVGEHVDSGPGYRIASVHGVPGYPDRTLAHARLIAAAPALLEALSNLIALMDRDAEANQANYAEIVLEEPEVASARAALLQARGEA